jgi:uracil-DNA glycosylase
MNLNQNWKSKLNNELTSDYFQKLWQTIELEYQTKTCFPDKDKIFEAFNQCDFDNINVVIIAQDPYHGDNQANGLCFSSNSNTPPSHQYFYSMNLNKIPRDYQHHHDTQAVYTFLQSFPYTY